MDKIYDDLPQTKHLISLTNILKDKQVLNEIKNDILGIKQEK
jgi:hypothetical protein